MIILFHEFVHAKQDLVDGKVIEREGNNIIQYTYEIMYNKELLQEKENDFFELLDVCDIPRNLSDCNEEQKMRWENYYKEHVLPIKNAVESNKTYTVKYNIDDTNNEIEAYSMQYKKYIGKMSSKLERETLNNIKTFQKDLNQINKYGRKID